MSDDGGGRRATPNQRRSVPRLARRLRNRQAETLTEKVSVSSVGSAGYAHRGRASRRTGRAADTTRRAVRRQLHFRAGAEAEHERKQKGSQDKFRLHGEFAFP